MKTSGGKRSVDTNSYQKQMSYERTGLQIYRLAHNYSKISEEEKNIYIRNKEQGGLIEMTHMKQISADSKNRMRKVVLNWQKNANPTSS